MTSLIIKTPNAFSFQECLYFLNRSPHEILHYCSPNSVKKLLKIEGENVLIRIKEKNRYELKVDFLNKPAVKKVEHQVRNYVEEWFDIKTQLDPFYELMKNDLLLKQLTEKYFGYRIVSIPDLFESLCWAIIGQQINLNFAYTMKKRFIEHFGEKFIYEGTPYYLFPASSRIATLEPSQLLPLQFSRQKAAYVTGIARAFEDATISKEKLMNLPFDEAKKELLKLKGIGNWTANYALMKTFHHPNAFPLEDAGLHQAIRNLRKMKRKPTLKEVARLFRKYKGWEAYATLYFWRSLGADE